MTEIRPNSIWLTWERQRRNRSMAAATGATLYEIEYHGHAIARYCNLIWRTVRVINDSKPDVIFFQNPSIVLAALVSMMKALKLIRYITVGDFHNAGVFPPYGRFLSAFIIRHTDIVIVSNENLASEVRGQGGFALAIPDPIPEFHACSSEELRSEVFNVLFICSWAPDEPIIEVLQAAKLIGDEGAIAIAVTGRPRLELVGWNETLPGNVTLTHFLSEAEFEKRLLHASVVVDLTTRSDCMVCGAYEAVAAGVPMILSDNKPTRAYFTQGVLFTNNSAVDIANKIRMAHANHRELSHQVKVLRKELEEQDSRAMQALADAIRAAMSDSKRTRCSYGS